MERAASLKVGAALLQRNEIPHHIHYLGGVKNPVYNILRYHLLLVHLFKINVFRLGDIFLSRSLRIHLVDCLAHLP